MVAQHADVLIGAGIGSDAIGDPDRHRIDHLGAIIVVQRSELEVHMTVGYIGRTCGVGRVQGEGIGDRTGAGRGPLSKRGDPRDLSVQIEGCDLIAPGLVLTCVHIRRWCEVEHHRITCIVAGVNRAQRQRHRSHHCIHRARDVCWGEHRIVRVECSGTRRGPLDLRRITGGNSVQLQAGVVRAKRHIRSCIHAAVWKDVDMDRIRIGHTRTGVRRGKDQVDAKIQ